MERQNDRSIVLRIAHGGKSILLCGDVEEIGAVQVAAQLRAIGEQTGVILLPHHGAEFLGQEGFAELVRAQVGIASCGWNGIAEPTRAAYEAAGTRVFTTGLRGAIRGQWVGGVLTIEQWDGRDRRWVEVYRDGGEIDAGRQNDWSEEEVQIRTTER